MVFDITKRETFENLHKWLYEVKNHSHEKVEIALVGNKVDLKAKYLPVHSDDKSHMKKL